MSLRSNRRDAKSTLLYKGNFDEWQWQMSDVFIAKGRPTQAYPSISHVRDDTTTYHPSNITGIQDILDYISPAVLARILLDELEAKAGVLYAWLEKLCNKPFRFFDLPAELRLRIYQMVIGQGWLKPIHFHEEEPARGAVDNRVPALVRTSRPLRHEALPVYLIAHLFYVSGDRGPCAVKALVKEWKEA